MTTYHELRARFEKELDEYQTQQLEKEMDEFDVSSWSRYMDEWDRLERRKRATELIGLTFAAISIITTVYLLSGV